MSRAADPTLERETTSSLSSKSISSEPAASALGLGRQGTQTGSASHVFYKSSISHFSDGGEAETKDAKHDDDNFNHSDMSLVKDSSAGRSVGFAATSIDLEAEEGSEEGGAVLPEIGQSRSNVIMQSQGTRNGGREGGVVIIHRAKCGVRGY